MNYLLDTCVISELVKKSPEKKVVKWISGISDSNLYLSVLTIGELIKGIEKLPVSRSEHKASLVNWVNNDLMERFSNRIIYIDINIIKHWGRILAETESEGKTMPAIDSLIAATGVTCDLIVVTRNIKDIECSGAAVLNPWG
ncbi:MAG: PIN domain-containing protein [Planctomycetota bacterium]|jgi:predicted nucleic acid-binding protein